MGVRPRIDIPCGPETLVEEVGRKDVERSNGVTGDYTKVEKIVETMSKRCKLREFNRVQDKRTNLPLTMEPQQSSQVLLPLSTYYPGHDFLRLTSRVYLPRLSSKRFYDRPEVKSWTSSLVPTSSLPDSLVVEI